MSPELQTWRQAGHHLPGILKDFHDQKEIFQAMHFMIGESGRSDLIRQPTWVEGQCYVVDVFLWFMARHGYTLQRSRAKQPFDSLKDNVAAVKAHRDACLELALTGASGLSGSALAKTEPNPLPDREPSS